MTELVKDELDALQRIYVAQDFGGNFDSMYLTIERTSGDNLHVRAFKYGQIEHTPAYLFLISGKMVIKFY